MRRFVDIAVRLQTGGPELPSEVLDSVRRLEKQVGAALVTLDGDQITLTTQGDELAEESLRALRLAAAAVEAARSTARTSIGTLRIGVAEAAMGPSLFELLRRYNERHPQSPVELVDLHHDELIVALEAGRIDVGFAFDGDLPVTVESLTIEHQPLVAILACDHPSAAADHLELSDLSRLRMIEYCARPSGTIAEQVGPILADGGLGRIKVDGPRNAILAAAAGLGVALLPAGVAGIVAKDRLRSLPIRAEDLGVDVVALFPLSSSDPLVEDLLELQPA